MGNMLEILQTVQKFRKAYIRALLHKSLALHPLTGRGLCVALEANFTCMI